jgi:hypothetical protein
MTISSRGRSPRAPAFLAPFVPLQPESDVGLGPERTSLVAVDRSREVGSPAELVGALLVHAEELGDLDKAKELARAHR